MPDTKPQACPKCGAVASEGMDRAWCSNRACEFHVHEIRREDWNRLRYVSEAAPKVRRMISQASRSPKHIGEHDRDGHCHVHGCQPVEAAPEKPRRMQACPNVGTPGAPCELCNHEKDHDETGFCEMIHPQSWCHLEKCQPVEAAPEKPRRMKGNPAEMGDGSPHGEEHDENEFCKVHPPCKPVEAEQPAAPCSNCGDTAGDDTCRKSCNLVAPDSADMLGPDPTHMVADLKASGAAKLLPWKAKDKAPDPGEGWRLLGDDEKTAGGDEAFNRVTVAWNPISPNTIGILARHCITKVRRRVEPQAQGWEDYALDFMGSCYLGFEHPKHGWQQSICAPSLRGFIEYVYADGTTSLHPIRKGTYKMEFPVAVRFEKNV